jgi:hypothetical protein
MHRLIVALVILSKSVIFKFVEHTHTLQANEPETQTCVRNLDEQVASYFAFMTSHSLQKEGARR